MKTQRALSRWFSPLLVLAVWEGVARLNWVDPFFLPAPSVILKVMLEMTLSGELPQHMGISLYRACTGYLIAAFLGVGLGLAMCQSRLIEGFLDPLVELLRPVSTLGLIPLLILWLGIGDSSKILLIVKACFFPILINTVAGMRGVNVKLIQAARSLGASGFVLWRKAVLPASLPMIVAGLRISTASSMLAIIGVEMLSADSGLGYLIVDAQRVFATSRMFVGLIVISALGFGMDDLARRLERRFLKWHTSTPAARQL